MRAKTIAEHASGSVSRLAPGHHRARNSGTHQRHGHRRMVTFRQRRKRRDGPWTRAAKWIVPAVILMGGMAVATGWIMALVMGAI